MPNYCDFNMRITGPKKSVEHFINAATVHYYGEPNDSEHFWRVFKFEVTDTQVKGNLMQIDAYGYCAWSVAVCFRQNGYQSSAAQPHNGVCLETFTKDHMLIVEYFSTECGCCFSEHGLIKFGEWEIDECNDYYMLCNDCELEDFNRLTGLNLTQEELNKLFTDREYITIGEPTYEFKDYLEVLNNEN